MNGTRVRPQNGPNLGAKRRRAVGPASICNDELAHFGASPLAAPARVPFISSTPSERWFFVFGFEKNSRADISDTELAAVQVLAADLLSLTPHQLNAAVHDGSLEEICHEPP